jgi:hypothetical protein
VASIHSVKWRVVPEPSDRITGMIRIAGRFSPGLSAAIAGSFHWVMTPVKILAMLSPDRRRLVVIARRRLRSRRQSTIDRPANWPCR